MPEKKEMTMEIRLLIFFVLMGLILLGTQYFYKPPPQAPPANKSPNVEPTQQQAQQSAKSNPPAGEPVPTPPPSATPATEMPRVEAQSEQTASIETSFYKVVFSNKGAVVKSWILKNYKDRDGKPLELVNEKAMAKLPAPFAIETKTKLATDPNVALFKMDQAGLSINFEFSDGRAVIKKSFQFAEKSYLVQVNSEISQNGVLIPHELDWRGGFGDQTVASPAADEHALYYDSKLQTKDSKEGKNGPVNFNGQFSFEGVEDKYFAAVFLPSGGASELTVYSDTVTNASNAEEQRAGASFGGEGVNIGELFVGPKDTDLLGTIDPKLEHLIDWGWFEIVAKPLFVMLHWTADHVTHNYGWAIMLVTIVINIALSPLSLQSLKSSRKMQKIQPQIKAINDKYKNISMRDPRKAEQNAEVMDLYKKEGVNPMGGCLPMLIQLPFFYGYYKVLYVSIAMRGASWLWVHDLSQTDIWHILPIVLVVTQFLTQKLTPTPGMDPSQQKMMYIMPMIFGYIFWFLSAGLVLYYLTSNLVAIGRQVIVNKMVGPAPAPAVVDVKSSPPKKRK